MVSDECKKISEAAAKVGLARETLSRNLSRPDIAEHLRQKVRRHLAIHAARAGATKVDLLDSDNAMARDRALNASYSATERFLVLICFQRSAEARQP